MAVMPSAHRAAEAKKYVIDGHVYIVSAEAMGCIEAVQIPHGANNSWKLALVETALTTAGDNADALLGIYIYSRFELDIHPRELGELSRKWQLNGGRADKLGEICLWSRRYHLAKVGQMSWSASR